METWTHTRMVVIRNEDTWDKGWVTSVEDKMRKARFKWFRYVKRRSTNAPIRRSEGLAIDSFRKGRGSQVSREYWGEMTKQDKSHFCLSKT